MAVLWRSSKKKHSSDAEMTKTKHRKGKKANLYASSGLEKFAACLEGLQETKSSLLEERTAALVSASRSLSRSAQVCAAEILVRNASRRAETKLVQSVAKSAEVAKWTQVRCENMCGDNLHQEIPTCVEEFEAAKGECLHRDEGNKGEKEPSQDTQISSEEVGSVALLGILLPVRTGRSRPVRKPWSSHCLEWRQTSKSAFVVLVALSAFISSRFGKFGTQVAAVTRFNEIARVWRMGKYYARFMLSSVAVYFLCPLRSRLTSQAFRRLNLKAICNPGSPLRTEVSEKPETAVSRDQRYSSVEIAADSSEHSDPLKILIPIPDSEAAAPATKDRETSGSSRRLAKRILSRFKKLKPNGSSRFSSVVLLRFSESTYSGISKPMSPFSQHSAAASSPGRGHRSIFSRLHYKSRKADLPSNSLDRINGKETATSLATNKKPIASRSCISPQEQRNPSENMCGKKSKMDRLAELPDLCIDGKTPSIISSSDIKTSPASSSPVLSVPPVDSRGASANQLPWPLLGLLVTLLFLLMGRIPAIIATSVFLVLVSEIHHVRAYRGRRERGTRTTVAARKLCASPPPHRRRYHGSPSRQA
uniref:Uncharacterized protein n=1 Tax=Physcomitrium patens TaxID=3218 RepID=A0A2K1JXB0_PHYPA|nr:hypothetical protein PHYPA_013248 [Physcomitrium patens]